MREQFTFYRSFYEAIMGLKPVEQTKVILAICEYALNGTEPQLSGTANSIFILIKPTLDSSARKSENGKKKSKTEANKKQTESKTEAKDYQTANEGEIEKEYEKEIEKEVEVEKEYEVEVENECENECLRGKTKTTTTTFASSVIAAYQQKLGSLLSSSAMRELVQTYIPRLGAELTEYGLDVALNNGRREWNYIRVILNSWLESGFTTVAQAVDAENERAEKKRKDAVSGGVKGSKAQELDSFYAMAREWAQDG